MSKEISFDDFLKELHKNLASTGKPNPKFLLVTCIDLRYPGLIHSKLESFVPAPGDPPYFHKKYDQVCFAGAGLAAVIDFPPHPKPNWSSSYVEHVAISKKLHDIVAVVVLEHRTCGAYKEFGLLTDKSTYDDETKAHDEQIVRMQDLLKKNGLRIPVYSLLLPEEHEKDMSFKMLRLGT